MREQEGERENMCISELHGCKEQTFVKLLPVVSSLLAVTENDCSLLMYYQSIKNRYIYRKKKSLLFHFFYQSSFLLFLFPISSVNLPDNRLNPECHCMRIFLHLQVNKE